MGLRSGPVRDRLTELDSKSEIQTGNDLPAAELAGWTEPEFEVEVLGSVFARVVGNEALTLASCEKVSTNRENGEAPVSLMLVLSVDVESPESASSYH